MSWKVLRVLTWIAVCCSVSCIAPMTFRGYIPSGDGELLESGIVGIKNRINVHIGAASLSTSATVETGHIAIYSGLSIPDGVVVRFLSPEFVIESKELGAPVTIDLKKIMTNGPRSFAPLSELQGATYYKGFTLWFADKQWAETHIPKLDTFTLHFPRIRVDNVDYDLAPVKFSYLEKTGLYIGRLGP